MLINITPKNIKIIIRYILPQREFSMFGTNYIPWGEIIDRVRYTDKMNKKLKELCELKNIMFLDNYLKKELIDDKGFLKDIYCDGLTHYNDNSIIHVDNEIDIFNNIIKITNK
jgi:hypothetical protein